MKIVRGTVWETLKGIVQGTVHRIVWETVWGDSLREKSIIWSLENSLM